VTIQSQFFLPAPLTSNLHPSPRGRCGTKGNPEPDFPLSHQNSCEDLTLFRSHSFHSASPVGIQQAYFPYSGLMETHYRTPGPCSAYAPHGLTDPDFHSWKTNKPRSFSLMTPRGNYRTCPSVLRPSSDTSSSPGEYRVKPSLTERWGNLPLTFWSTGPRSRHIFPSEETRRYIEGSAVATKTDLSEQPLDNTAFLETSGFNIRPYIKNSDVQSTAVHTQSTPPFSIHQKLSLLSVYRSDICSGSVSDNDHCVRNQPHPDTTLSDRHTQCLLCGPQVHDFFLCDSHNTSPRDTLYSKITTTVELKIF
jgi:hypothetical protein